MTLDEFLLPNGVFTQLHAGSKKQVLSEIAHKVSEDLGLERLSVAFARLNDPVDFDAADDEPVDLIAALLMPNDETQQSEYLKVLSKISRRLKDENLREKIRGADSGSAIFALLTGEPDQQAAA